jgi:hypothetical protein
MTLDELLPQRLAEWRFDNDRQSLTVTCPESGLAVDLVADCADGVGCRLWEAVLRPTSPRTGIDLKARADHVAAQVTGLLEPLKLIEIDALRRTAQMRSEEASQRGGDLHYYEVLLQDNGGASVRRYRGPRPGSPRREQQTFTLTHEALVKLIGDLAAS